VAQIDLAEVVRCGGPATLPDGALAFFLGPQHEEGEGAVLFVPRAELGAPTAPPPDAPAVLAPGGGTFPERYDDAAPRLFPRWPVELVVIDDPASDIEPPAPGADIALLDEYHDALYAARAAAVERHRARRQYFLGADEAYQVLGGIPRPHWWHTALYYAACLRAAARRVPDRAASLRRSLDDARGRLAPARPSGLDALRRALGLAASREAERRAADEVARCEAALAAFGRAADAFGPFVREVEARVLGQDPWRAMDAEEVAWLRAAVERGRREFADQTRYHAPTSFAELETETLLAALTADDAVYATVPAPVRALVDARYLLPTDAWHQMFGQGVDIQGNAASENEGNVMLLQLVYDDMLHWRFGDMGAFQFWIPPGELARANWAAARVTFECH
jgi:hypothetical protein